MSLWQPLLGGAAGFALAALLLKPLALSETGLPQGGWALVAVAALSVGVLEEGTRALLLRSTGWLGGRALAGVALGWALAELLLVGVAGFVQLHLLAAQPELLARAMAGLPAAAAATLERQVAAVAHGSAWTTLAWLLERLAAVAVQIGLTAALARGLQGSRPLHRAAGLLLVVLVHAAVDVPAAGFQAGLWPLTQVQLAYAGLALLLAPWAWRWCRRQLSPAAAPTARSAASG